MDPHRLREAFGSFPTGVTIVTTSFEGKPIGFTANSFTSVSLNPPLLLICPGKHLSSYDIFTKCSFFGVHILAEGQEILSTRFATYQGDRFEGLDWSMDSQGAPKLNGVTAYFSCKTHQVVDAGDHCILVGEVQNFEKYQRQGLGFLSGHYFNLGLEVKTQVETGRTQWVGVIAEWQDSIYLLKDTKGYALPCFKSMGRSSQRADLSNNLHELGVRAEIGRAYSIFTSRDDERDYIFFHGKILEEPELHSAEPSGCLVAIDDLGSLQFESLGVKSMLQRFTMEYQHRDFGLYMGDEYEGELHKF